MTALYFDLDGTLVHHEISFEEMFERARHEANVSDHDGLHDEYVTSFLDYFGECHPEPYRAALDDLCNDFSLDTDGETFADALIEVELSHTDLVDGAHELLASFADDPDHELGILTNGAGHVQRAKLETHGLDSYFDAVVVSCEVGVGKPESGIFEVAKEKLSGDGFVFVADDVERDVLPAQRAGFTGVLLSESVDSRADNCVEELSAVRTLLA
ncbi:putative hydrolase of the HAD superfamily [Haladaptatus litoreus]|uniref:Putative hydrolase of the HAD superfamily n=1 Tax=Haladaptatus litoreus TaxID=553468 RepID=A0A1N6WVL0_9EURY|nr:HAD family hydrolase [Haladaptatus litoreus]SIQ94139.1 putative hydrolase of the HAD superfamily [Haladaptatus litoreus]